MLKNKSHGASEGPVPTRSPATAPSANSVNGDRVIQKLAALSPIEYEREREQAAASLDIRLAALDKLVKESKADKSSVTPPGSTAVKLWRHPIKGSALLNNLARSIRRYVVMRPEEVDVVALWALY